MFKNFDLKDIDFTKYIFFTGKGGVGKTSTACALAVALADSGKKIMLISTDPASNLQDVFNTELNNKGVTIKEVPNLIVANFDPEEAAAEYRESVIGPYRGKLPEIVIENMEEQLSGSCTVEIAAFNEFSGFITDKKVAEAYDHIIFDTAPTGHTLLLLESTQSYNKEITRTQGDIPESVQKLLPKLKDDSLTEVLIITLAEATPFYEAKRLQEDLYRAGIFSKWWIINSSFYGTNSSNEILKAKSASEVQWINAVNEISNGNFSLISWTPEELRGENLTNLF